MSQTFKLSLESELLRELRADRTVTPTGGCYSHDTIQTQLHESLRSMYRAKVYASAMESLSGKLKSATARNKPPGKLVERSLRIAAEALNEITIGVAPKKFRFPTKQEFGTTMSRSDAATQAAEGFGELAQAAKNSIIALIRRFVEWVRKFWEYLTKGAEDFLEKVKEAKKMKEEVIRHEKQLLLEGSTSHVQPLRVLPPDRSRKMNAFRANRWSRVFPNPDNAIAQKANYLDEAYTSAMLKTVHACESAQTRFIQELAQQMNLAAKRLLVTNPDNTLMGETLSEEKIDTLAKRFLKIVQIVDPSASVDGEKISFSFPCGLMSYTLTLHDHAAKCVGSNEPYRDLIDNVRESKGNGRMHKVPSEKDYKVFGEFLGSYLSDAKEQSESLVKSLEKVAGADLNNLPAKDSMYREYIAFWLLHASACIQLYGAVAQSANDVSSGTTAFWALTLLKEPPPQVSD